MDMHSKKEAQSFSQKFVKRMPLLQLLYKLDLSMMFEVEVRAKFRDPQITDPVQTHLEKYELQKSSETLLT